MSPRKSDGCAPASMRAIWLTMARVRHVRSEYEMVKREIEATDGQIDRLVYELYGLSEEEIKIVEGKSGV